MFEYRQARLSPETCHFPIMAGCPTGVQLSRFAFLESSADTARLMALFVAASVAQSGLSYPCQRTFSSVVTALHSRVRKATTFPHSAGTKNGGRARGFPTLVGHLERELGCEGLKGTGGVP